jgi:P27 family predicted phage terminase small subunit
MGERGPLPTPVELHLLRGNPSKKPLSRLLDETLRVPVEIPELPTFLKYGGSGPELAVEARAEWERITPHLQQLGLISQIDRAAAVSYCFWWALGVLAKKRLIELGDEAIIDRTPSGYKQIGVWLQVANRADANVATFLGHFGMSPASRSRVTPSDMQLPLPGMPTPVESGWSKV